MALWAGTFCPLFGTLAFSLSGEQGEKSLGFFLEQLPFLSFVFPGKQDTPDQAKANKTSAPKGENELLLSVFWSFLAFHPSLSTPKVLFQNNHVILA